MQEPGICRLADVALSQGTQRGARFPRRAASIGDPPAPPGQNRTSHHLIWVIAAASTAGVVLRPWKLPETVWAVIGAVLLALLGLLSWVNVGRAVGKGTDVYLFLVGMMLLSELARREGLFDYAAGVGVPLFSVSKVTVRARALARVLTSRHLQVPVTS